VRAHATSHFLDQYNAAPRDVQRAFRKQLGFLLRDRRHPLRAPGHVEHRFRRKPNTHSDASRTPIPGRSNTLSGHR